MPRIRRDTREPVAATVASPRPAPPIPVAQPAETAGKPKRQRAAKPTGLLAIGDDFELEQDDDVIT